MRIAVCQFAAGADVAANTAECVGLIAAAAAAGADLAVLPEASMYFDPRHQGGPAPHGQDLEGPFGTAIADAAAGSGVAVLVGMLESAPAGPATTTRCSPSRRPVRRSAATERCTCTTRSATGSPTTTCPARSPSR